MKKVWIVLVVLAGVLLAACDPNWGIASGGAGSAVAVSGGTCDNTGHGDPWPTVTGEQYKLQNRNGEATGDNIGDGFDTYVSSEGFGLQTGSAQSVCSGVDSYNSTTNSGNGPANVSISANYSNTNTCGGCIQAYPKVSQLFNDFNRTTGQWDGNPSATDTPLTDLPSLTSTFRIPPADSHGNAQNDVTKGDWEWAYDLWPSGNCSAESDSDAMLWVDTSNVRVAENYGGMTTVTTGTWDNHPFQYGTFGSSPSQEPVIALTANDTGDTVNLKDLFNFFVSEGIWKAYDPANPGTCVDANGHGVDPGPLSIHEVDFGIELAGTGNTTSHGTNSEQHFQQANYQLVGVGSPG